MARKTAGTRGGTPATVALSASGVPFSLHSYEHEPSAASYGEQAIAALGVEPGRVLKTLLADVGQELVVAVVPVPAKLDLKALAAAVGAKRAVMAEPATAERETGYVVGGISPIGQRRRHRTVLDDSALQWPTVLVSGGRRGLSLELAPADLVAVTGAIAAVIAR